MTTVIQQEKQRNYVKAREILNDLYQNIDEVFISYFISLTTPRTWRPHLEKYESDLFKALQEEEYSIPEIEERIAEKDHIFSDGEFQVQTKTKNLRKILAPGNFENVQAKNAVKIVYDSWESLYRPMLEELLGEKLQSDIWGDLGYLRHSITHRNSKGTDKIKNTKLIKNFIPGQEIILTPTIMEKIRQELENWYTEFLMKHFS